MEVRGGGPLEGDLRAQATRLGVAARFAGYASPAELPAAYAELVDAHVLGERHVGG